jgi:hypothetical protein
MYVPLLKLTWRFIYENLFLWVHLWVIGGYKPMYIGVDLVSVRCNA